MLQPSKVQTYLKLLKRVFSHTDKITNFVNHALRLPDSFHSNELSNLLEQHKADVATIAIARLVHKLWKPVWDTLVEHEIALPEPVQNRLRVLEEFVRHMHPLNQDTVLQITLDEGAPTTSRPILALTSELAHGLIRSEEVHKFSGTEHQQLEDLRQRVGGENRLLYVMADPCDPNGAIISVQVALTQGLPDNVHEVIAGGNLPSSMPDTAVFYTISNWKRLSLAVGKDFLFEVVQRLQADHPHVTNFVTMSPMPRFHNWVESVDDGTLHALGAARVLTYNIHTIREQLKDLKNSAEFQQHPTLLADLHKLAAFYVTGGARTETGHFKAWDPVADFHPRNGAIPCRIIPNANAAERGWKESYGFMVNYAYQLAELCLIADLSKQAAAFRSGQGRCAPALMHLKTAQTTTGASARIVPRHG